MTHPSALLRLNSGWSMPSNGRANELGCAPGISEDASTAIAKTFKALADPHRVRIINLLAKANQPVCVCEMMPALRLSQGTVSCHLCQRRTRWRVISNFARRSVSAT
jgi:Bacterial regulatory protein, arsR family